MKRLLLLALVACGPKPTPTPPPTIPTGDGVAAMRPPAPPPRDKAIAQPALLLKPLPNDPMKVTIHRLSNGMTVYLSPDSQDPTIVAHVVVHAGSSNDPELSTGLAHYLEHMLFKGTTKLGTLDYAKEKPHLDKIAELYAELRKPGSDRDQVLKNIDAETQKTAEVAIPNELDRLYARMGVKGLNAFTNNDATVYVTNIPKNRVPQWARVEATRYQDAVFRLFWPELEAVYEEKNISLDNPGRRAHEAFMRTMFPKHGYGWSSTLGEIDHLKSPAYGDMIAFFNRYYTPQNMAILLSGDVDESVLPILEKEFGSFTRPAGDARDAGAMPALHGRVQVDVSVPSQEGVLLGWPLVAAAATDRVPLEVMDSLMLDGPDGIIKRELLLPQKVSDAGSNYSFLRDSGYWQLYADALVGQSRDELEKMLLALVAKLQHGEFTDADLQAAVLTDDIRMQKRFESNGGRMQVMEEAFVTGIDWRDAVSHIEQLRKVTKADIVRVANKYLTKDFIALEKIKGVVKPPKIIKPGITAVKVDPTRESEFAKSVVDMPAPPIEPVSIHEGRDYSRGTMPTGELVTVKNTRNGLFSVAYDFDVGRFDDRFTCLALEVLKVSGAGKRSPAEVSDQLHKLGVELDTGCGKDRSSITISGIDRNLEAGLTLIREWIADPAFDEEVVKRSIAAALTERANQLADPRSIAAAAAQYARFGADSDLLVVATNKQLEAVTAAQIKKLIEAFGHYTHRTSYFGPRSTTEVAAAAVLGDGKRATSPRKPLRFRRSDGVVATDQETTQTQVWLIWPKRPSNDADRAAGTLFSSYIGPTLYQEVREARGLAYSVFGGYGASSRKADDASVYAYVGTQGDKTHDALDAVMATLHEPVDDARLTAAKEGIVEGHRVERISPRAIPSVVYSWEDQGEKDDPRDARTERVVKLDKAALEKWMKANLGNQLTVSITGDRKKLDEGKLKKIAPVTFVPVDKLFGY